jgi:hypothetical protein
MLSIEIIDIESADSDISIPLKCPIFPRSRNWYYRNWMLYINVIIFTDFLIPCMQNFITHKMIPNAAL